MPADPAVALVHVPAGELHTSQAPAHGVSQQNPSAQWDETHWAFRVHAPPWDSAGTQTPRLQ